MKQQEKLPKPKKTGSINTSSSAVSHVCPLFCTAWRQNRTKFSLLVVLTSLPLTMVRPRLVQEGNPIVNSQVRRPNEHNVGVMPQGVQKQATSSQQQYSSTSSCSSSQEASSLLQAAGGQIPSPHRHKYTAASRFTINDDAMDDDSVMHTSALSIQNQYRHPSSSPQNLSPIQHGSHFGNGQSSPSQPQSANSSHNGPNARENKSAYTGTSHTYSQPSHFQIGADYRPLERMEGVEDHSEKTPLVVLDGANLSYAYAQTLLGVDNRHRRARFDPDVRGIRVACEYFVQAGLRVLAVLPSSWYNQKPRAGNNLSAENAWMQQDQLETLRLLREKSWLVGAPPTDDDDAYVLTIAQRENVRASRRHGQHGPAFVLSNDLFRDAQDRDATEQLRGWLQNGIDSHGPGRISYAFVDMGQLDEYGQRELDIVPNPRHPLVLCIEQSHSVAQRHI